MHVLLFEDHLTAENRPVALPRAAFAVGTAGSRLYDVARRYASGVSAVVRDYLRAQTEKDFELVPTAGRDVLCVNASMAPSFEVLDRLTEEAGSGGNFVVQDGSRLAAAYFAELPEEIKRQDVQSITSFLLGRDYRSIREELPLVNFPFDIMRYHRRYFAGNAQRLTDGLREIRPGVFAGEGVTIHPTCVMEADEGPIILHDGVSVGPFSLLVGPVLVGAGSRIIERASLKEEVQIGHTCKVGGEVECSVMEPFSNKQHHGFLGHAYVGSWVNMGAGTSNSDLKNTYGEVAVLHRGERVETGMQFVGCVIGDYSKTAINTSIFTGKSIGVSSHVYGLVGTNVPSFTNYAVSFGQQTEYLLEAAVKTQQRMFARRGVEQTPLDVRLLEDMHEMTRDERLMSNDPLRF